MSESKKKHLYCVDFNAPNSDTSVFYVIANSRQQAINAVSSRFITAERADPLVVVRDGIKPEAVIDATTGHAQQEPLPLAEPAGTAAEQMEPKGNAYLDGVAARAEDEPAKAVTDGE